VSTWLLAPLSALLVVVAACALALHAGIYNVAADVPHTGPVFWLLQTARERSVAVRATTVAVPADLGNARRIVSGAGQYAEMCADCHLAPGLKRTEIARGLYPRAPELRRGTDLTPAEEFWVVKHGLKMTGMPAWGVTHDDEVLWDVVAFLRKLPELTPDQYQSLVQSAPRTHQHESNVEDAPR
jgi:mono/diheme cytochrome c family protein